MREYNIVEVTQKILTAKTCDICHMKTAITDDFELEEFTTIYKNCGYASIFGDGSEFLIDICQHCLKRVIDAFNIKVDYSGENLD